MITNITNGVTTLTMAPEEIRNSRQVREAIIKYLLTYRMHYSTYDYSPSYLSELRRRHDEAEETLLSAWRELPIDALNWRSINYSPWTIECYTTEKVELSYTVFSFGNEEITDMMIDLCDNLPLKKVA